MSKVVIITRRIAYDSGKAFYKIKEFEELEKSNYSARNITAGKGKIHEYVYEILKSAFINIDNDEDRFYNLTTSEHDDRKALMVELHKKAKAREESNEQNNTDDEQNGELTAEESDADSMNKIETLFEGCIPILQKILGTYSQPEDCDVKPYVCFTHKDENNSEEVEVCFVFLNRILGLFVETSHEYKSFVNGKDKDERLEFIKAICEDCDVKKGEENILYIHDKEWYEDGKEDCVLYKGQWEPKYATKSYKTELGEYFHTIQVFMHNSTTFERIKKLNFIFPEKDAEEAIKRRSFF